MRKKLFEHIGNNAFKLSENKQSVKIRGFYPNHNDRGLAVELEITNIDIPSIINHQETMNITVIVPVKDFDVGGYHGKSHDEYPRDFDWNQGPLTRDNIIIVDDWVSVVNDHNEREIKFSQIPDEYKNTIKTAIESCIDSSSEFESQFDNYARDNFPEGKGKYSRSH